MIKQNALPFFFACGARTTLPVGFDVNRRICEHSDHLRCLSAALERQGRMGEATEQYRKSVEVDPENAGAYTNLAVALVDAGKLDEAIDCLQRCIANNPQSAKAQSNLGALLMEKGRLNEAIEHWPGCSGT